MTPTVRLCSPVLQIGTFVCGARCRPNVWLSIDLTFPQFGAWQCIRNPIVSPRAPWIGLFACGHLNVWTFFEHWSITPMMSLLSHSIRMANISLRGRAMVWSFSGRLNRLNRHAFSNPRCPSNDWHLQRMAIIWFPPRVHMDRIRPIQLASGIFVRRQNDVWSKIFRVLVGYWSPVRYTILNDSSPVSISLCLSSMLVMQEKGRISPVRTFLISLWNGCCISRHISRTSCSSLPNNCTLISSFPDDSQTTAKANDSRRHSPRIRRFRESWKWFQTTNNNWRNK